ncbi:MAG: ribbon-helix-helix protein, CopG family [Romboutsia timonensis]
MGYKKPEDLKNATVKVAITQGMKEEIEQYCMEADISISEFLRRAISNLLVMGSEDCEG